MSLNLRAISFLSHYSKTGIRIYAHSIQPKNHASGIPNYSIYASPFLPHKSTFYKGNRDNVRRSTTVPYIYHNNHRRSSPEDLLTDNIIAAHTKMQRFHSLPRLSGKTESVKHSRIALFLPE